VATGYSPFRIEADEAKILSDPFLSDNWSKDNGQGRTMERLR
jgi:L-ascorbate metabolism protein UlaG (beta-lactamase superfamily)